MMKKLEKEMVSVSQTLMHMICCTVLRAIEFYHDKPVWDRLVKQAMTEDYSWEKSALAYKKLYKSLME